MEPYLSGLATVDAGGDVTELRSQSLPILSQRRRLGLPPNLRGNECLLDDVGK